MAALQIVEPKEGGISGHNIPLAHIRVLTKFGLPARLHAGRNH